MEINYVTHSYEDIKMTFLRYIKNEDDIKNIERAYLFACEKHKDQKRVSGAPYIEHLLEVTYILATLGVGPLTLMAGFLHDTVEDTSCTIEEITSIFGSDVAYLVDGVTKIQELSKRKESEIEAETHRKIFIAMARDIRVIIIKLADRLHNMRTLNFLSKERQMRIAKETLDVYAPIAHRLGINTIKAELEDLSLYYLDREKYDEIIKLLNQTSIDRKKTMISLQKKIADMLIKTNIPFEITSRIKEVYSIYKKMYVKGRKFDEIYDIMALRIITKTELNCYEILGYIHSMYRPIPGRFKDYIAMPKPNMYQSLHTTIMTQGGSIFEIQIRTSDMDEVAETGVAAHWKYKEGSHYDPKKEQKEIEEKLHWFRDFVSMSGTKDVKDAREYIASLTHDIFDANVYVFTPKGKVIELPEGATPIDFAYKIHSHIGDATVGAKVNNVLVPLATKLKTGDICEIKTSSTSPGPNEGWLHIVKTTLARNHIKKFLVKKNKEFLRDDGIVKGKQILSEALQEYNLSLKDAISKMDDNFFSKLAFNNVDDLLFGISQKNPPVSVIIEALNLKEALTKEEIVQNILKKSPYKASNDVNQCVTIQGINNVKVVLAPCCSPIKGDAIKGYITRGQGIKVHRKECPNIQKEMFRTIDCVWNPSYTSKFKANIEILSNDRANLLIDVMSLFSTLKVPCNNLHAKSHSETSTATVIVSLMVSDTKELLDIFNHLRSIEGVYDIRRIMK